MPPGWTVLPMMTLGPMPKPVMRPLRSPPSMRNSLRSVGVPAPPVFVSVRSLVPACGPSFTAAIVQLRSRPGPTVISSDLPANCERSASPSRLRTACRSAASTVIVSVSASTAAKLTTLPSAEVSLPTSSATLSSSKTVVKSTCVFSSAKKSMLRPVMAYCVADVVAVTFGGPGSLRQLEGLTDEIGDAVEVPGRIADQIQQIGRKHVHELDCALAAACGERRHRAVGRADVELRS